MRKYIFLIFLAFLLFASPLWAGQLVPIYEPIESVPACVTTNITFWWRAESLQLNDECVDVDDPVAGCTGVNTGALDYSPGDQLATVVSTAAINADAKKIGTNGLDVPQPTDYLYFSVSAEDLIVSSESRVGFWFRYTDWADGATILTSTDNSPATTIQLEMVDSNELRFYWYDNYGARTNFDTDGLNLVSATWYFIEMAWKTSTDYREIFVNGNSAGSSSQTIADSGVALVIMYFGNTTGEDSDFHMDNIMISSDSTDALYPCRDEVEWPE